MNLFKCSKVSHRIRGILWSIALLLAVTLGWMNLPAVESSGPTTSAPVWNLKSLDGKIIRSSDFKGKIVIVDFWATWCPPCREEIPEFIALQKQYGKDDVAVIGVCLDGGNVSAVKRFVDSMGVNYPIVLGDEDTVRAFGGFDIIPTTFVIDRQGRIVARHGGLTEKSELEKDLKPLLNR